MLRIEHLVKDFGRLRAVDDLSLAVERGEVLGFLGPNGAGKSTTMKMVTGYLEPTAGRVLVDGFDVQERPLEVKSRLGYLPEGAPLYPEMTVASFLDFIADMRGLRGEERRRRLGEAVERTHLEEVRRQSIETLSKGFKRRVGLAQAILHDPEILILDEPTDGLDPNQKHEVRQLIREMARDKVIVLSTHILEEVEAVCTRASIIARGRLVFDGTPLELKQRSRYHGAVTLWVDEEDRSAAAEVLRGLGEIEEDRGSLTVVPPRGATILDAVLEGLRERRIRLRSLRVEDGRLDQVFRDLTSGAPAPVEGNGPAGPQEVEEEAGAAGEPAAAQTGGEA